MKRPPEMSRKAFAAALERNGFDRPVLFWIRDRQTAGVSYGVILHPNGKLARRATLAHILRSRAKHQEKNRNA